jgi:transcriptional regulator with PAS, ATPase and Fis domain
MNLDWAKEFEGAITICDLDGTVTYMNDKAAEAFKDDGGFNLIGKSLFDCHSENSNKIIFSILNEKKPNIYTIEKNGKKKMIYQAPWLNNNKVCGIVELSFEIPFEMPHHIRQ